MLFKTLHLFQPFILSDVFDCFLCYYAQNAFPCTADCLSVCQTLTLQQPQLDNVLQKPIFFMPHNVVVEDNFIVPMGQLGLLNIVVVVVLALKQNQNLSNGIATNNGFTRWGQ